MRYATVRRMLYPKIALTVASVIILSSVLIWHSSRTFILEQSINTLHETASIVLNLLSEEYPQLQGDTNGELQQRIEELARGSSARLTVVAVDGKVLADTAEDPASMENHRNRPEIMRALTGLSSSNLRFSTTLQIDMLYHAVPLYSEDGSLHAVLRVAMPYRRTASVLTQIILLIGAGALLFIVLSALLVVYIDRRIEQPLVWLADEADKESAFAEQNTSIIRTSAEIRRLYSALRDLTRRQHSQIADIRKQKQELQAVLDAMENAVLVLNSQGRIVKANPAAADILRTLKEEQYLNKYYNQVLSNIELNALVEQALRSGSAETVISDDRLEIALQDRRYQVSVSVVSPEPEMTVLLVLNDVTRILHLEKVRRDFVANVSHELKTPVTSIKGFAETLLYQNIQPDDTRYAKFLTIILNQTERLHAIIEDLLTLSMLESQDKSFAMRPAAVSELINDSVTICREKNCGTSRSIITSCDRELTAVCNPLLVEQALINLIENALKYSDPLTPVTVSCTDRGENIEIAVSDEGYGIPEHLLHRIFERFYRVDKGRSRDKGGTGLGLSIVKHIMMKHNGSVRVISREGKGSTFYLTFPVTRKEAEQTRI
jgi:two-component system, OmpR family, phosphate regulon sensor histidine kinase PhoR